MKNKVTVKGFFQDKQLSGISKIMSCMDLGIANIGFHMEFSYITDSVVDEDYTKRLKEYLVSNQWNEDLICLSVEEISISFDNSLK